MRPALCYIVSAPLIKMGVVMANQQKRVNQETAFDHPRPSFLAQMDRFMEQHGTCNLKHVVQLQCTCAYRIYT